MTDLANAPTEASTDEWEIHYACCANNDIALCGATLPEGEGWFNIEGGETTCADCDLVEMNQACPIWGRCTWYA